MTIHFINTVTQISLSACIFCSYQESFEKAVEEVKILKQRPNHEELSALYGLYKQATAGDVNIGECFWHCRIWKTEIVKRDCSVIFWAIQYCAKIHSEVWLRKKMRPDELGVILWMMAKLIIYIELSTLSYILQIINGGNTFDCMCTWEKKHHYLHEYSKWGF